jgi:hypothetical protein
MSVLIVRGMLGTFVSCIKALQGGGLFRGTAAMCISSANLAIIGGEN